MGMYMHIALLQISKDMLLFFCQISIEYEFHKFFNVFAIIMLCM